MSQDRPDEPEPTRLAGGTPPQQPPQQPQPQQPPQQQPWSPAGDQRPPQQPGYGPPPQGQPGYGQQQPGYGPPPQGGGYGQGPQGPYGPGPGGYGGPAGPGGYGPPPGGYGPGGPGGPGGPRRPSDKKPLIIAGVVLVVLLIVGGIGLVLVMGGDDDGADVATDDTSQSDEPTEAEPTEEPAETEEAPQETDFPTFEAGDLLEVGQVCEERAMTNAADYDPADPRISSYAAAPETLEYSPQYMGYGEDWGVDSDRHEDNSVIMCLSGEASGETRTCEAEDLDENVVEYEYVGVDYAVQFREALTGAVISEGETVSGSAGSCPEFAIVFEEGEDQFAQPLTDDLDDAANAFVDAAPEAP